jgi:ABC-type dipeptide/oligopeptide/nickel transport system permease subunit
MRVTEKTLKNSLLNPLRSRKISVSLTIITVFVFTGLTAPYIAPHDPNKQSLRDASLPPSWVDGGNPSYLLGTDSLGRDILSRLLHGASVALYVASTATFLTGIVGTLLGVAAGYIRGKFDELLMRVVDIWMSFPPIILAIALISLLGTGINNVVFAIAVVDWTRFTRVIRSEVLAIREKDFIAAAIAAGFSTNYIVWREILPNILPTVIVLATLEMGIAVSVEVLLSFVGLGVKPTTPSWGTMLSDGLLYLRTNPFGIIFPLISTMLVVLSLNIFGEGIREKTDPKLEVLR